MSLRILRTCYPSGPTRNERHFAPRPADAAGEVHAADRWMPDAELAGEVSRDFAVYAARAVSLIAAISSRVV